MKDLKYILEALGGMLAFFGFEILGRMIGGTIGAIIIKNLWFIPLLIGATYLWKRSSSLKNLAYISVVGYALYFLYKIMERLI